MFRTILVPLDGSPFAEQALPWALSIARRSGASLDLVRGHVLYALREPAAAWGPYDPVMDAECKQQEQMYLDGTARWLASMMPVPMSTAVVGGPATEGILERIRDRKADLVVMNTHARGPLGRFFQGSMADQVVRQSAVPVLVVHAGTPAPGPIPEPVVARVLIALDGSALAEQVLAPATELARLLEARCVLVRVIESGAGSQSPAGSEEADALANLNRVADRLRERGPAVEVHILSARSAAEGILGQARSGDVIALTTHGSSGLRRLVAGSVADKVIRESHCPVLVYRPGVGRCRASVHCAGQTAKEEWP